jgi:hypothetical protein
VTLPADVRGEAAEPDTAIATDQTLLQLPPFYEAGDVAIEYRRSYDQYNRASNSSSSKLLSLN